MQFLFVHQNFPAQFRHLAPALVQQGHTVVALALTPQVPDGWQGIRVVRYQPQRGSTPGVHPWVVDLETKTIRGEAAFHAARALRNAGFAPDALIAHPSWGESLFLHEVWPRVPLGILCEMFYQPEKQDSGFDPEFDPSPDHELLAARLRMKNANHLMHLDRAAAGISPTQFQADSFPQPFRQRILTVHEGVDTRVLAPNAQARLLIPTSSGDGAPQPSSGLMSGAPLQGFTRQDEIVTFVNRHFEPMRGCHVFFRALPELLARRPTLKVLMVGADGAGYGAAAPEGSTWRQLFWNEIATSLPEEARNRIHFAGTLARDDFTRMLQVSTVHVYLSYPFVLSWSLIEAMSCGCAIVGSDVAPVREAITHGDNGLLVNFFDRAGLVDNICHLLEQPTLRQQLGQNARAHAQARYDLQSHCLPRQMAWARALTQMPPR